MESTLANSAQGLVIAPKAVLAEAQNVFTQIGASVDTVSLEAFAELKPKPEQEKPTSSSLFM
ncbi:MAG TPA: hypothetical protein VHV32_00830 [Candidatus Angelobacter sp.]|jgi:hypothetical protein|nr:hypothetical protein [Candidatus Angelobacter sp.]